MPNILSCYYLDDPLTDEELAFVARTLTGYWARFKTGAQEVHQVRVPGVLPLPDENGEYADSREERAQRVRHNLRHAGIRGDAGRRVVWVMPKDADWDAVFQFAIREETGFAPFVAQRWFPKDGEQVRGSLRVIDTDMLLRGLES
ncbi:MAG TPA: hypothetical protein VM406_01390 [Noviherbaspirillum sp.]|nr:hypothetical protein [Noviherbaspirillum sp.]